MNATSDSIRVLHVDDDPDLASMVATFLEREDDRITVRTALSAADGLDALASHDVDCVVSDHEMPGRNGIEFLEVVRKADPSLPFILYTGKGSEEVASDAISAGVSDYLQKESGTEQYTVLANKITNAVEAQQARRERQRQLDAIEAAQEGISILDEDERFVYVNETYAGLYGYDPEEMIGEHWKLIYREEDVQRVREEVLPHVRETGYWHGTTTGVRADDSTFTEDHVLATTDRGELVCAVWDITERKERQRELEETRARFQALTTNTTHVVVTIDEESTVKYVNGAVEDVLGYTSEELVGESLLAVVPERLRDAHREAIARYHREGTRRLDWDWIELPGLHKDGHEVPLGISFGDATVGGESRFTAVIRDITDRKEREEKLERARDLLERTERIADVGGWELDTETMDVFWTEHLFDLFGLDPGEEPPLEDALDIYHEDDRSTVEDALLAALDSGEPFDLEVRFRHPDDGIRWLRVRGTPTIEDGEVVTLRGAVQDVTERKEREDDLRETTLRLEAVFENSPDMINVHDPEGTILDVNRRFCEELGYEESDVLGTPIWQIDRMVDAGGVKRLISDIALGQRRKFEGRYERRDGSTVPVEVHLLRLRLDGEDRFLAISRNISERKERERKLEQQNEQLGQFASIVSHDLRNPLNVAQGRVELAREECGSEHLDAVERAHRRMDTLISDLLTLARNGQHSTDLTSVGLATLAENCWRNVDTRDATLVTGTDRTIRADENRLCQLFENLVRNSVEHGGPSVTVTIGSLDDGFYVEDDGPGISPDDCDDVFEVGYSTSRNGTGFGLGIVRQIVAAHEWDIRVTEGTDGGARFEITGVEFVAD